jgi:hypothetical protein
LNQTELQQRFNHAQQENEFFAAQAMWDSNQARACIFFRPAWRTREAAYAFAMYLPDDGAHVAVEQNIQAALTVLRRHGYADEQWQDVDRLGCHHNVAPIDEERLWNAGYGVIRQSGLWRDTTITLAGIGTSHPGKELVGAGLGYWIGKDKGEPTFYAPTHILSGYKASAATFYSEDICKQFMTALAELMNWNRPIKDLVEDPAYQPEQFNELAKKYWIEDAGQARQVAELRRQVAELQAQNTKLTTDIKALRDMDRKIFDEQDGKIADLKALVKDYEAMLQRWDPITDDFKQEHPYDKARLDLNERAKQLLGEEPTK